MGEGSAVGPDATPLDGAIDIANPIGDAIADTTPSPDASVDAPVDAPPDVIVDAGPDASLTFCQLLVPAPTFCADFDNPATVDPAFGWDTSTAGAGSTLGLVASQFSSSPRSMQATTTSGQAATVQRSFTMATSISFEFDVRFAALPVDGQALSPFLLTPPTFPGFDIYWFVDANNAYFQEYGDDYSPSQTQPTINAWHKVTLSLSTNGTNSVISASVDGTTYWSNHTLLHPWPTNTTATFRVGAARPYAQGNNVFIDNVIVKVN